ncbi:dipeptidase (plasmid) [Deinococcus taeanensis]|uniref:dipeptidase n=1 Tax=Deinococcus taeanensis TaxID=2737050 RepID=UPI001CDB8714|nr:dipeptidase [Deinococcus taeanensis]UBV44293.1 dipeptidase [Deinococcus taeanensis]
MSARPPAADAGLAQVLATLQGRSAASLNDLLAFAAIPSVSAQAAHAPDVRRAADWLAARLRQAGLAAVEQWPTAGHPAVYAEWLGAPGAPTLLVYGHYDVQPPDPEDRWRTPPFTPTVQGERVYGRGVSDDKGPLLIAVQVADAYLSALGRLPVNVKFLFEGEEEVGSAHLPALVAARRGRLQADFVLSADGGMWSAETPSLTVSARGLAALEFTVRGPAKDLHSGRHGGSLHNPLHAIAALVASLHAADGRVAVDGFYDGVSDRTPAERQAIRALPFTDAAYLEQTGAPATYGEAGYSTLERQWTRPTLELNGLWGGYAGEGSKTVLPGEAHAKITCRLVPGQDPARMPALIEAHLRRHLPPGVTLEVRAGAHGARAYELPAAHPGRRVARQVLETVYGRAPLEVGMGGSIPVLETFSELLGVDTVFFSFAVGDEDIHAPNEFFRLARLGEGQEAWARYWAALAADAGPGGQP